MIRENKIVFTTVGFLAGIRLLSLFPLVSARGPEMTQAETVTPAQ